MENEGIINAFIESLKIKTGLNAVVEESKINIYSISNRGMIYLEDGKEQVGEMEEFKEILFYIDIEEVLTLENECKKYEIFDSENYGFGIVSNSYFESAVEVTRPGFSSYSSILQNRLNEAQVKENGYTIEITKLSSSYLYFLFMHEKFKDEEIDRILRIRTSRLSNDDITITNSFKDFAEIIMINTCKIIKNESNEQKISIKNYQKMAQSYLFNVSYSLGIMLDFHKFKRMRRVTSRVKREIQLFPYKKYNKNLIKYYYQGISSEIPFVQYIAFYHILEHFFFSVSEEEVYDKIKGLITSPSFLPKNKNSIKELYETLKKISRSQTEDGVWRENEAFLLCLNKLIPDLESLKTNLYKLNADYEEYYKTNVEFIGEDISINFEEDDKNKIYRRIRDRKSTRLNSSH